MADTVQTEQVAPDWMQGFVPQPTAKKARAGNPSWTPGCKSPNPSGRPKGIIDKRVKVTQALLDDAHSVARVVIDAALEGDIQAASLVLARVAPALKSTMEKVAFDFDASAPVATQVEQVLQAIADGAVSADVGKQIIDAISALSSVRATEDLQARIEALEAKQGV
ncbi:DUF5681 domain-containing protein [Novosphingobium humi]|uniref:DUF5681 domain-containing protein n=1 Tax=Novosphingobium humi TaxID=2282397 RepID=UPI0025B0B715|nr:DUF5681 domain-containing protein [Novosphingobium humi]WJS98917.1 hypothetical protein NYQ05_01815 [Novosphingobium humi]